MPGLDVLNNVIYSRLCCFRKEVYSGLLLIDGFMVTRNTDHF